jgi:ribonuclease HI
VVLCDPRDREVATDSERIGLETVQGAEYRALMRGLELAHDLGIDKFRAFLDNQLVVDQINDMAAVRDDHLKPLHQTTMEFLEMFRDTRVYWVPRERNKRADALVREVLYGRSVLTWRRWMRRIAASRFDRCCAGQPCFPICPSIPTRSQPRAP